MDIHSNVHHPWQIKIENSASKGRSLFAMVDFKAEDVIFTELPIICCQFAWNEDYGYRACSHCLRALESLQENVNRLSGKDYVIPSKYLQFDTTCKDEHTKCDSCQVEYCSEDCQQAAWHTYHKLICYKRLDEGEPLRILREKWKQMHYPPESANIMMLARMVAYVEQGKDYAEKETRFNILSRFVPSSNAFDGSDNELLCAQIGENVQAMGELFISTLAPMLEDNQINRQLISPDGFKRLYLKVARNGQGVGTSTVANWASNVLKNAHFDEGEDVEFQEFLDKLYEEIDSHMGDFINNEGSALYVMQSCVNHSCMPNARVAFLESCFKLTLVAERDIAAGEEICISYLEECQLRRGKIHRKEILRENYAFDCKCEKCEMQEDLESETSDESMQE